MADRTINRSEETTRELTAADDFFFILYSNGERSSLRAGQPSAQTRELADRVGNKVVRLRTVDATPDARIDCGFDPSLSYLVA